ncbi:MAG: hypothetical protein M0P94_00785 [Candidatus Absconditabacterales bacterium]|nr:hypothetical protein [Candidatus Absconditabacterales bacterium]
MQKNNFDIVVKNLFKYKNKLIEIDKIKDIVEKILDSEYSENKAYKIIYHLKNKGYLLNLKKGMFLVKNPEKEYQEQQLLDMFYWCIAKKHCKEFASNKWYIGGIKALEFNITNFDIPEELLIINDYKQSLETVMFEKQVSFKTYESNNKNLFSLFKKFTKNIYVGKNVFPIANIELAILESLYNPSVVNKGYIEELIKKIIRKHKKSLNLSVFEEILKKSKHHSSINRLYKLSLSIDPELSENLKNIIKKYSYIL